MSAFSNVDAAPDGSRLVDMLEESARGLAAMKHYMAVTHALRRPRTPILDIGCGAGHDLAVLETLGLAAVGVDSSATMLRAAAARVRSRLVQSDGASLPFGKSTFAGCWIERVLMHVPDPSAVVAEAVRCLEPGGLLTVFEPDWSSLTANGRQVPTEWVSAARHPSIGAVVGELLESAGCALLDRVEERSWWSFETFARVTNLEQAMARAVTNGALDRASAEAWLVEQRRRAETGEFTAQLTKILWVATAPR